MTITADDVHAYTWGRMDITWRRTHCALAGVDQLNAAFDWGELPAEARPVIAKQMREGVEIIARSRIAQGVA